MADYVVKLTGQDGLTPTLKNVKQELQNTGNVAKTELTKITERFEQIEKSSMPVKREIKAITDLMAKMNAEGMSNDLDVYKQMAARAGELTDALGDARQAARLLSSDTANLDAGIQAFSGLTAAATAAWTMAAMSPLPEPLSPWPEPLPLPEPSPEPDSGCAAL